MFDKSILDFSGIRLSTSIISFSKRGPPKSPLSLNPALTGIGEYGRFGVNYRNQWPSISKGYQTFSSWMDYNFEENNNNIGLILSRSQEGFAGLNSNFIGVNFSKVFIIVNENRFF